MGHKHVSNKKVWLNSHNGIVKKHPYCMVCGTVKNVSSDRGKKMSHFVLALSKLKKVLKNKNYKVSEAQIRLILKELKDLDFGDVWWITYTKQREIFIRVVQKHIRVSRELLEALI